MKVEILIENEFTNETETINAVDFDNARIITNHLNKEHKVRVTTKRGIMTFGSSNMNMWAEISDYFEPEKKVGFLGYVD